MAEVVAVLAILSVVVPSLVFLARREQSDRRRAESMRLATQLVLVDSWAGSVLRSSPQAAPYVYAEAVGWLTSAGWSGEELAQVLVTLRVRCEPVLRR
jgi:hypothetical protein